MGHSETLTPEISPDQLRAIAALTSGQSVVDVAASVGVGRATLYRWLDDPEFIADLNKAKLDLANRLSNELMGLAVEALSTIRELLRPGVPPAIRLRAATVIVEAAAVRPQPIGPTTPDGVIKKLCADNLRNDLQPWGQV